MAEIFRCEDCRKWFSYLEVNLKANDALVARI
jgi:hypothetical protein